jgi:hypothetical protein
LRFQCFHQSGTGLPVDDELHFKSVEAVKAHGRNLVV